MSKFGGEHESHVSILLLSDCSVVPNVYRLRGYHLTVGQMQLDVVR
jgi:hypothetical protein